MSTDAVAQQLVTFLVGRIVSQAERIGRESQGETKFVAGELKLHCEQLQKSIETLFADAGNEPTPSTNRGRRSNA